ncbi:hypothetical protein Tel_05540 [Candidatus Tenderia electrophaga]|jgi:UDP-perosamine 4-acetyltransferase|uniref:PglD N-terminal domain-containing protein n=1 Tax=Candidatus Tenderia electrophaga TaxID=1748243 RepID=A0A0S2TBU9_9GAMM|nr:hypothetical protein Tel_05540 [Candidatus Tenderia electrophaga]
MNRPVIILGGGGHAKVLAEALLRMQRSIIGFTDPQPHASLLQDIPHLGGDETVFEHRPDTVLLVNGLGSVGDTRARQALFAGFIEKDYRFAAVTHPRAILSRTDVETGQGCQILAGAVVNPGVRLGDNVIINSGAIVEHDCRIGDHVHISSGALVCGGCSIEEGAHIGAGAIIIQGITIGHGTVVAAGSVVISNVDPLTLVAGVPAQVKRGRA